MVTLGGFVLKVSDAGRAARFWSEALGYVPEPERPWVLRPPAGGPLLFLDEDDRMAHEVGEVVQTAVFE